MSTFDENDYIPKRFGISCSPPQIVVEYDKPSKNKLYHHKIKIKNLTKETKISDIVDEIYKKHGPYLNNKKVNKVKIIQLIEKLREKYFAQKESDEKVSNEKPKKTINDYIIDIDLNENLNVLSKEELDKKKEKMDEYYEQNNIKVGDKNFKYDVRKDFPDNGQFPAEWDDDDEI